MAVLESRHYQAARERIKGNPVIAMMAAGVVTMPLTRLAHEDEIARVLAEIDTTELLSSPERTFFQYESTDNSKREDKAANMPFKPDDQPLFNSAHEVAYAELAQTLLSDLADVDSPGSEQIFIREAAKKIRETSRRVPEFYAGEFLNLFKDSAVERTRTAVEECRRLMAEANAEADAASADLEKRLGAARASNDYEAEHAVWRDREARQAACQAKIDDATARMAPMSFRLEAVEGLAAALGLHFQ